MGYRSPYMRFGNTRYEKNIAKLRRYDLNIREEAYKDAVKTLNEVITEPDSSQNYIDNVVTEHGIARLRGTDYSTRAQRLIEVAHPDHREDLYREARELNIISRLSAK